MIEDDNQFTPLRFDVELRPRGTSPVGVRGLLGPLLERYVQGMAEVTECLKQLAVVYVRQKEES